MHSPTMDLSALEDLRTSGAYVKRDIQIVRGEGARLFDSEGRSYIDFVAGQGSANLGHCHPAVVAAITQQAAELITCNEMFHNPVRARYQDALCEATGMARVFLCNSGAEANEGALKFAALKTGRNRFISTMRGFHGRTLGALSATWDKTYREPFAELIPNTAFVPYNNIERMAAEMDDTVAAVIVETVQGEGGVHPAESGYLCAVQELCRQHGALLIIDEVQTGFGRTGSLLAHWQDRAGSPDLSPDLVTVAKSMAGGLPMGAVLMHERVGEFSHAAHGSTFGGNPLACASALAVLNVLQTTDLMERARTRGEQVREYFRTNLPEMAYREVRGRGFHFGIELRGKVGPTLRALQERGVLALPAGLTVLRLLPPLVIEDEDLWQGAQVIVEVLSNAI